MSEPLVEGPSEAGPAEGPAPAEQAEAQRMAEVWANERPNVVEELRQSRKDAEPKPARSESAGLMAEAALLMTQYASAKVDERDAAIAGREEDQVVNWAQQVATDYEAEPEEVAAAADQLIDTVGVDDYRAQEFLGQWFESDPEAAQEFVAQRMWTNHYAMEEAAAQANAAEAQAHADREAAMTKMTEEFADDHANMPPGYIAEMARLAAIAGVPLNGSPAEVRVQLDALAGTLRELDAEAEPTKEPTGWNVPVAWAATQGDAILNAGPSLRGRSESMQDFQARMAERGYGVFANGDVYTPADPHEVLARASDRTAPGARITPEQFDAQEQARLAAVWNLRPSVHGERHGERDAQGRYAAAQKVAQAATPARSPAGDPDDPGGFWAYTLHERFS